MRRLLILFIIVGFFFGIPAAFLWAAVEQQPAVGKVPLVDAEAAARARALLHRFKHSLERSERVHTLSVSRQDLNGLLAFAARGVPGFGGRVDAEPSAVTLVTTVQLPPNPRGRYLNLSLSLATSETGLRVGDLKAGPVRVPGDLLQPLVKLGLDLALGEDLGSVGMDAIRSIDVQRDVITVGYRLAKRDLVRVKDRMKERLAAAEPLGDPETVQVYYAALVDIGRSGTIRSGSVAQLVGPVFQLARERSAQADPTDENRAAILALAMYCGNLLFENIIGAVRTPDLKAHVPACRRQVVLGGRHDLMLHFIYSAALKLASDSGVAFVAGEFKEVLDSGRGGSGFSFADLAADRAGVRFAEVATDGDAGARRLQAILAGQNLESLFFPRVDGLSEAMTEAEFKRRYGGVDSAAYRAVVADIDRRIADCAAYQGGGSA